MAMQDFSTKSPDYFANERSEIAPLLPTRTSDILEIGCGNGETMAWLRREYEIAVAVGIEYVPEMADKARRHFNQVIVGNVEQDALPAGPFDVILALDVLEHLVDPWAVIRKLHAVLKPGGALVISLPHVGHYSVALPLLFLDRWTYRSAGLLDRTHLRFFSRAGAIELATSSGLHLNRVLPHRPAPASMKLSRSSRWYWRRVLETLPLPPQFDYQYLVRADAPE